MLRTHKTLLNSFLVKSPILMPQESVCESGDKRYPRVIKQLMNERDHFRSQAAEAHVSRKAND